MEETMPMKTADRPEGPAAGDRLHDLAKRHGGHQQRSDELDLPESRPAAAGPALHPTGRRGLRHLSQVSQST